MKNLEDLKVAFLGFGNMASAFADGLLAAKALKPENMGASSLHYGELFEKTQSRGMKAFKTNAEAVKWADIVIVAVKPPVVPAVIKEVKKHLKGKVLLSVAVNILFDDYEKMLPAKTHHLSLLPNTPVAINEGVLLCEAKHSLTDAEKAAVDTLLGSLGLLVYVSCAQMKAAGTISGCGPAFVAMFIESLGDAAVKYGVPRALAYELASQTLVGTAKLQLKTKNHPGAMKDAVCSPAGTTIKGVSSLEKNSFRGTVISAIDAILEPKA